MQLGSQLHAIAATKQQTNIFAQFYQSCLCERVKKCSFYNFHPLFALTLSSLCSPSITLSLCVFLRRAWYSITTLSFICMRKHPLCRHKRRPRHSPSPPTYTHSTHPSSTLPSRTNALNQHKHEKNAARVNKFFGFSSSIAHFDTFKSFFFFAPSLSLLSHLFAPVFFFISFATK